MTARAADISIEPFDPKTADPSSDLYQAFHLFADARHAEENPDDPPMPHEVREAWWRTRPAHSVTRLWVAREGGRVIGAGRLSFETLEENRHVGDMYVDVLDTERRRGVGRQLLAPVVQAAEEEGRTLLITWSTDRTQGGAALDHLGAQAALPMLTSQLDLAELDTSLLDDWIVRGAERAEGFDVGFWEGRFPEDRLAEIAALVEVMNTAPRGDLDVEDEKVTPDLLRASDESRERSGWQRVMAYATERATGKLAGFTELAWREAVPGVVSQWGTGVWPEFRERGLGRLLKAANMKRLLERYPEARVVRTGNADVNAAMLGINRAMGFKPYVKATVYQIPTERLREYVSRGAPAKETA